MSMLRNKLTRNAFVEWFHRFLYYWTTLNNLRDLVNAGFRVTRSSYDDPVIYRFFWNHRIIQDIADIDRINGKYVSVFNGKITNLNTMRKEDF